MKHQQQKFRRIEFQERSGQLVDRKMKELLENKRQASFMIKSKSKGKKSKSKQKMRKTVSIGQIDYEQIKQKQMQALQVKIKKCDILGIIQREKYLEVPLVSKDEIFNEKKELHNSLTNVRKRCDEVKRIEIQKNREMEQIKKDIEQLDVQIQMLEYERDSIANNVGEMKQQLDGIKYNIDKASLENQSLEYMLTRYRKDGIQYQLRSQRMEDKKAKLQKKIRQLIEVNQNHIQMFQQSTYVLNTLLKNLQEDGWIRHHKFGILKETIQVKVEAETKRNNWIQKKKQVVDFAGQEMKQWNEKEQRNLLLANRFLLSFLKSKMKRMISQYGSVETGYQRIKTQTGVDSIEEIVSKFMNKEAIYDGLLKQINQYQSEIKKLKSSNFNMNNQLVCYQVKSQHMKQKEIQEGQKQQKEYLQKYDQINKQLANIYDKEKKIKIVEQQIRVFTNRVNHKIGKMDGDIYKYDDVEGDFQTQFMAASGLLFQQFKQIRNIKEMNKDKSICFNKTFVVQNSESYVKRNIRVDKALSRMVQSQGFNSVKNQNQNQDGMNIRYLQSDESEEMNEDQKEQFEKREIQYIKQLRRESKKQFEAGAKKRRHKQ